MVVINRSLRSAGGSGGSFNIESVILDEETQKLSIVSTKENTTVDKETPVTQVSLDGRKLPVVNGRYNIVSTMSEDGKSQILDITDWNYSNLPNFDEVFGNNTPEQISAISAEIVKNGYNYPVRVSLGKSDFPKKEYGDMILPAGTYTALTVEIGEGKGDNWWCVMFPPLCFADESYVTTARQRREILIDSLGKETYEMVTDNITIKFKLYEVIKNFI